MGCSNRLNLVHFPAKHLYSCAGLSTQGRATLSLGLIETYHTAESPGKACFLEPCASDNVCFPKEIENSLEIQLVCGRAAGDIAHLYIYIFFSIA